jgi:hypothetical protein
VRNGVEGYPVSRCSDSERAVVNSAIIADG